MPKTLRGACECGTVVFLVTDSFQYAMNCHCSNCRAATGSAFKAMAGIERDQLEIVSGEDRLIIVGEREAHDARCQRCGSLLYSVVRNGEYAHVAMGSLTDAPTISPTHHIFVGSKAPWFEITDTLPQHDEY